MQRFVVAKLDCLCDHCYADELPTIDVQSGCFLFSIDVRHMHGSSSPLTPLHCTVDDALIKIILFLF